jgi:hypothetical protein
LEGTNNYKTRVKFLAPNEWTRDQNNKDSSIQHKHPKLLAPNKSTHNFHHPIKGPKTKKEKLLAPNKTTRELEVSTQRFHAPRRTTKVKL